MKQYKINFVVNSEVDAEKLHRDATKVCSNNNCNIISGEVISESGLTGAEVALTIIISVGSSVIANSIQPSIDNLIKKIKKTTSVTISRIKTKNIEGSTEND